MKSSHWIQKFQKQENRYFPAQTVLWCDITFHFHLFKRVYACYAVLQIYQLPFSHLISLGGLEEKEKAANVA